MCGILCYVKKIASKFEIDTDELFEFIRSRGPDDFGNFSQNILTDSSEEIALCLKSSVLWIRGDLTKQPIQECDKKNKMHVFSWNGEIFGGDVEVPPNENDTKILFEKICSHDSKCSLKDYLVSLFSKINGPWAFVYYNEEFQQLWYGRDYFGRRSLTVNFTNESLVLSSIALKNETMISQEITAKRLYCLNLKKLDLNNPMDCVEEYPLVSPFPAVHQNLFLCQHRCDKKDCGTNFNSGESFFEDGKQLHCLKPISLEELRDEFLNNFCQSVRTRVTNIRNSEVNKENTPQIGILFSGGIDSVMITAIAHRYVPANEPIDLINVAFGQKTSNNIQNVKKKHLKKLKEFELEEISFEVPDRITGKEALKELPKNRTWNFVEVNVGLEELQMCRKERISKLVYPLETVLDDSIGCAIWFAARGKGIKYQFVNEEFSTIEDEYVSPVKVLLCGMGADEQLGGYARHRTKFQKEGWVGLTEEMKMEIERISTRNLGRDDRCISDHGKESRFPFLDERLVAFLQQIPTCVKCDPTLPRGQGEKILLREVASSLGLHFASSLPKRAIQFGSKIAKLESGKEKGSDSCIRLN